MTTDGFRVSIEDPRPSQLFLSARKLHAASAWFDFDNPQYDPLPVLPADELGFERGDPVLIDGHTRAYLAHLAGVDELLVHDATDEDHFLALYADCAAWCDRKGMVSIADFAGRVVSHETYERQWVERCRRVAGVLSE